MKHPEFLTKIDWKLLQRQKETLNEVISEMLNGRQDSRYRPPQYQLDSLEGILCLIDALQDHATDEMGISEKEVFNLNPEEE